MRDELPASYADRTVMRELLAGSAITFAGSMVANVLGVAYTIGMARLLAPPAYADLVTLLSLLGVASLPGSTIQTIVARATALAIGRNEPHAGNQVLTRIGRGVVLAAVIAFLCTLVAVPWLGRFLQLGEVASLWPFAALIGLGFLHPLLRGLAQGQARYALLTAVGLLDSVGKVAGGTFLVWAGLGVTGAIGALLGASIASLGTATYYLRDQLRVPDSGDPGDFTGDQTVPVPVTTSTYLDWRDALGTLGGVGGLISLVTLDAVLVKHALPPADASAYAVLSVAGRSLFWASGSITTVLLPVVSRQIGSSGGTKRSSVLVLSLAITTALIGAGQGAFVIAPELVIGLLFGPAHLGAAGLLALYGWGACALALANVTTTYLIGHGSRLVGIVMPACAILQAILILDASSGLEELLVRLVMVNVAALSLCLALAYFLRETPRQPTAV